MKLSLNWLRDYVPLPDDVDRLVETLNGLGIEVGDVDHVGGVPGVVTARVVRMERHPDAATVIRVWVDRGDGVEHHVWCGASNFSPGDVVPLATVGTAMPDGRTIGSRGILGIPSDGMLCSPRELGVGGDHSGILVLPADTALGVPYGEVSGLVDDVVFDVDVTRNRPDAFGHVGVARDLAAKLQLPFTAPRPTLPALGNPAEATVEIVAGERCGRFTLTVLSGIVIGPSAAWMAARLSAVGQRPINNVVDVSNYVMLELNQPNHAYDLATLGGRDQAASFGGEDPARTEAAPAASRSERVNGIRVRTAKDGEQLTTLDGMTRTLTMDELLICDAHDVPIGLAGIMGGEHTEIGDRTSTVALEFAWFEPLGIAASVTRTGLRSDASARWERGVDAYGIDKSIARFVELLGETCPDLVVHTGAVDARAESLPPESRSTSLRVSQANRIIGVEVSRDEVARLLDPIGFTVTGDDPEALTVNLPSWRPDSTAEIDVIEEIARHYGYDNVPRRVPLSPLHGHLSPVQQRRRQVRAVLLGLGVSEVMPSPFLSADDLRRTGLDLEVLRITNPLVAEEDILRPSLRPGLLRAIAFNAAHRRPGVALFEVGHVYRPGPGELPDEREMLGVVLAGSAAPAAITAWREVAATLGVGARIDQGRVPAGLHPTRSAALVAGRDEIGAVGEVAPGVLDAYEIRERVAILELDLSTVLATEAKPARWKATSRHPSSDLDMAFELDEEIPAEKLDKAIRQGAGSLLVGLELFDVYRGPGVTDGSRSLAYRLRLQAPDRTLTDADTATVVAQVRAATEKLGAHLRQ
jgi:phenylalanyl-tRNA synthetase beta chain